MKKFQEMLYNMAMNEDEVFSPEDAREASDLYEASKNMSDDELAIFVADHDDKLRSVLGISPYFPEDFRAEYNNLYTQGKEAFYDEGVKLRGAGKSKSLDDFMKAFRLFGENSGYSKRDISSFTNPESPYYWGRRSEDDKLNAAASLGYTNIEDMERDLNQLAVDQQHTAAIEGYNPDGTINVGGWLISAGEGLVLPRVKEAQLARREVTAKDVVGDLTELGLNFVPGVGFFNKSGKLVARMAGAGIESLAVPLGTNIYDVVFYGGDEFNPKTHILLIDGKPAFTFTPWRSDCGRYREWNPVSGNFWNGMSSSDFSRSGWCPGTATQPVYFDLIDYFRRQRLNPTGSHTLTVAIPQGEPQAGSFSHWCVSGVIVED